MSKKKCCTICRHVEFKGTIMAKCPVQKHNTQNSTKTHRTARRKKHSEKQILFVFFGQMTYFNIYEHTTYMFILKKKDR